MANWDEAWEEAAAYAPDDNTWEEAAAYAPDDNTWVDTLEINNADLTTPIRVCNSFQPLVVGSMTFQPFYFEITLPEVTAGSLPQMKLSIGNFSAELRAALRLIKTSNSGTSVKYRQYRIVDDVPTLGDYMDLPMPVSTIDIPSGDAMISVTCEPTNIVNLPLHRKFYTTSRFPGLRV